MPRKKSNMTPTGNNASSSFEEADKGNIIVTHFSTEVGPSTVPKNTHEVSIRMPEREEEESVGRSEGEDDDQTTQETEGELNDDKEILLVKSLRKMGIKPPKHFDPKKNRNFETWLERTDFHLAVNECADEHKTRAILFFLNDDFFEAAKYLGITKSTPYDEAKQKLKDYYAITETKEELVEKLNFRQQEKNESIQSFARNIKIIGHRAYPDGDLEILEKLLIKVFTNGLRDEKLKERVLLYKPNTLTEAAKYAQFSEAVVRVVHNGSYSACAASSNSVNTMNITNRGRRGQQCHSAPPFNNQRGRGGYYSRGQFGGRSFSRGRGIWTLHQNNSQFNNRVGGYYNNASVCGYRCFNCNRMGHIARKFRAPKQQYFQQRGV